MVRQSPSNLQAHPHRLARAASLTALAAALSIGLPAGAQAEEPAAAGPDTQTAVEQLTAEEPPLSSTLADSPVDDSDLPAGSGTPGGTPADAVSSTDEETPTPTESGATTETGSTATADTPAAGAPVQTEEGAPEQDPQPALPNEASESDASNQAGTADQTADAETAAGAEAAGSADPSTGAGSAEAIATDAAVSPTPADAAVLEEGSSDEPADGQDGPSGTVELLAGDGFHYAFVTDGAECILWDYVTLEGVVEVPYVGPGVYLWVDADVASFTAPAQVDGQPVVSVAAESSALSALDLSAAAPTIASLYFHYVNLTSIDLSDCAALRSIHVFHAPLTVLDVSGCPLLEELNCSYSNVAELDVSNSPHLAFLFCMQTNLVRLDLSNNHELGIVLAQRSQIEEILLPTPSAMGGFVIDDNCLDAEAVAAIESWAEPIKDQLFLFSIGEQRVPEEPEEPEEPENPDDSDDDDIRLELIQGEGFRYAILADSGDLVDDLDSFEAGDEIANYGGVGAYLWVDEGATSFTAPAQIDGWPVRSVDCSDCGLSSLDLSEAASTLTVLICENNNLTSLDLSACTELRRIVCGGNQLAALDVSNSPELSTLHCVGGSLTEIDLSHNPRLTSLMLTDMPIKRVDISHNPEIMVFSCFDTQLEELVLPAVPCEMALMILYGNHLSADTMAEIQAWCDANRTAVVFGEQHAPENPDDPNEPSEPVDPSNPNDPDNPGAGEDPDKPAGPTDPGQGGTTGEKPGRPSGQQGGSGQGGQTGAIPQTGDENATGSAAALGMLGGAAALAGTGALALRRKADRSR